MKILLGHHGIRGDLAINVPALSYIHRQMGAQIDMPVHQQFADMLPIFANHPAFNTVLTDDYERFPSAKDNDLLQSRAYDHVFNPMQPHLDEWWQHRHQTAAVLWDYFQQPLPPEYEQIVLSRWFNVTPNKGWIAFAPFAGWSHERKSDKMLTVKRAQQIVNGLTKRGYKVLQIGGPGEPVLKNTTCKPLSYFESVKAVLGCDALLHTDTGMGWVISGYQHPQLGLYGHRYYGPEKVGNIQPRNPNGLWLDAPTVNDIHLDRIFDSLDTLIKAGIKPFRQNFADGPNVLRDLIEATTKTQVDAKTKEIDAVAKATVNRLAGELQREQADTIANCRKTVEEPANQWEVFKKRWFPKQALARWPVKTVKVDYWQSSA